MYDNEHLPRLVTVPGVVRARRYTAVSDNGPKYLTVYELTDRDAFESPEGLQARKTPWTAKMRSLFQNTRRNMCSLILPGVTHERAVAKARMTGALVLTHIEEREAGRIARITVNNPESRNALGRKGKEELIAAFATLAGDDKLRVAVLTGAGGKSFIGGADLKEMAAVGVEDAEDISTKTHLVCDAIRRLPVPVIARINGYCLGAGMEIAASCDMRVGVDSARFGMPEVKFGIPSGMEACLLPGLIGWGKTRELVFTGEMIDARGSAPLRFSRQDGCRGGSRSRRRKMGGGHPCRRTARDTHSEETGVGLGAHAGRRRRQAGNRCSGRSAQNGRTETPDDGIRQPQAKAISGLPCTCLNTMPRNCWRSTGSPFRRVA